MGETSGAGIEEQFRQIDQARQKSRPELVGESILALTRAYTSMNTGNFPDLPPDPAEEPALTALDARINALAVKYGLQDLSSADRESISKAIRFFHDFGIRMTPVYEGYAAWLAETCRINDFGTDMALFFGGRDALPLYLAADRNTLLHGYRPVWFNSGRKQMDFLTFDSWWKRDPDPIILRLEAVLAGRTRAGFLDFGFKSSVDRTLVAYREYLRKAGKMSVPKLDQQFFGLFFDYGCINPLDFHDVERHLYEKTPRRILGILRSADKISRGWVVGYINNLNDYVMNGKRDAPAFLIKNRDSVSILNDGLAYLVNIQELGASVGENTRETFLPREKRVAERALPLKPLQILAGRLAYLQALKDHLGHREEKFDPEVMAALSDSFLHWRENKPLFVTLADKSVKSHISHYPDETMPDIIQKTQMMLFATGKLHASD